MEWGKGKGKVRRTKKGSGKAPGPGLELDFQLATRPRARTYERTKRNETMSRLVGVFRTRDRRYLGRFIDWGETSYGLNICVQCDHDWHLEYNGKGKLVYCKRSLSHSRHSIRDLQCLQPVRRSRENRSSRRRRRPAMTAGSPRGAHARQWCSLRHSGSR